MPDRAKRWRSEVDAWERSGLSQAEFCRRRAIRLGAFGWWKRRLKGVTPKGKRVRRTLPERRVRRGRRRSAVPHRADFVEVTLPQRFQAVRSTLPEGVVPGDSTTGRGRHGGDSGGYEIALRSGHVLRVPQDFDAAAVAQLIAAVGATPQNPAQHIT